VHKKSLTPGQVTFKFRGQTQYHVVDMGAGSFHSFAILAHKKNKGEAKVRRRLVRMLCHARRYRWLRMTGCVIRGLLFSGEASIVHGQPHNASHCPLRSCLRGAPMARASLDWTMVTTRRATGSSPRR
jgi:hypothetical protein